MPKLLSIIAILAVSLYTATMGYSLGVITQSDSSISTAFLRQVVHRRSDLAFYAPTEWKTWHDGRLSKDGKTYEGFSLKYPRDFEAFGGDNASGNFIGQASVKVAFPQDSYLKPKTNFSEGYLTVSVSRAADAVRKCYDNPNAASVEKTLSNVMTVNGINFRRGDTAEAAAGNRYDSRVYRTLRGTDCYEAVLTVHTGAIGNYDPGTVAEFDKDKAFLILEKVFSTFTFEEKEPSR